MPTPTPRYLQHFESDLLSQIFCDVLVVGSGIAGHSAALAASSAGASVLVLTKDGPLESNTYYAQAGIAAPIGAGDSVDAHVRDTLAAGDGLCHVEVVRSVVEGASGAVSFLREYGVVFDRDQASAELRLGREGGHSARRVAHVHGDATGQEFQRVLSAGLMGADRTRRLCGAFVVDILTHEGRCVGVIVLVGRELRVVWAGAVVLATGGAGRLFRESTNPSVTTGDGLAMAYRAGAELRDMEFMQFHPTVLYVPGAGRTLLSEAARGEGAKVLDVRGRRFLADYDERGELAPRDVVARSMVAHMLAHGDTHVLLDMSGIDAERLASRLPGVVATGRDIGLDVTRDPLPIRPAAHYTLGGVVVDDDGRSSVPGLFAAGEVSSTGLHGANRLASNSLLEGVVVGRRSGRAAAAEAAGHAPRPLTVVSAGAGRAHGAVDSQDVVQSVDSLLWRDAGVQRSGEGLRNAQQLLASWSPLVLEREMPHPAGMEAQNLCLLASLLVNCAILREETRGVHWRTDHPARDDAQFRGHFHVSRGREPHFEALADGVAGT